jgi:S-adenosylmethionine/arginine decarboxylase-like enzyme
MGGRHIKVLGRGSPEALGNPKTVGDFVRLLVERLEMRMLGEPQVHEVEQDIRKLGAEPFEDEGGVTAVGVLSTSHVALHTWPLRAKDPLSEMFVLDVFSCRSFRDDVVLRFLTEHLHTYGYVVSDLTFALEYDRTRRSA